MSTAEARQGYEMGEVHATAAAALASGQVVASPIGGGGYVLGMDARASGDAVAIGGVASAGVKRVTKGSVVFLPGQEVWWDASSNVATVRAVGDFYLGRAVLDAATGDTSVLVAFGVDGPGGAPSDDFATIGVAAAAGGGFVGYGGNLTLAATSQAEKADMLGLHSVAITGDWIFEATVCVNANGSSATDFNVGVANATHATSADSITESCFIHIDGGSTNILAESDDGTTEVAATDTTVDFTAGTPFTVTMDGRDPSDVQVYLDGVNVLSGSTFALDDGTGPLKALAHLEKTTGTETAQIQVLGMRLWSCVPGITT